MSDVAAIREKIAAVRAVMQLRTERCMRGEHETYPVEILPGEFIWFCRNSECWWHYPDFMTIQLNPQAGGVK